MAQQYSFLFLPDISGFTDFVSHTEVEHSQHIVAELLELLIDNEKLGLTLAEIEGDALFYYKTGSVPDPKALIQQVENMYVKFHSHLKLYENHRICNCGACSTANNLTLKFFAHAGPLDFIQIKDQRKPYGKEVITAHRLMKNTIPIDDYLLLSEGVYDHWTSSIETSLPMKNSQSEYDLGVVKYQYYELMELKKKAQLSSFSKIKKPDNKPLFSASIVIEKSPQEVFELITNFEYRLDWTKGIQGLEYEKNRVNRVGSKHQCVVNGSTLEFETVADERREEKLVYGEMTNAIPVLKPFFNFYTIEANGTHSKVTAEAITENNSFLGYFIKPIIKRKLKPSFQAALKDLKSFAEGR
ncbi:MAG: hypothetical protein ACI8P3_001690 [Saprospiraceae bacterium]|jgi:hypothetical protein